jgi:hypothetical protein
MVLTNDEKKSLETFSGINLNKVQVEAIIRRPLTDREWRSYTRDFKSIVSSVEKQASNITTTKIKIIHLHFNTTINHLDQATAALRRGTPRG